MGLLSQASTLAKKTFTYLLLILLISDYCFNICLLSPTLLTTEEPKFAILCVMTPFYFLECLTESVVTEFTYHFYLLSFSLPRM